MAELQVQALSPGAGVELAPVLDDAYTMLALNNADPAAAQPGRDAAGAPVIQPLHPVLGDARVRRALAAALDLRAIARDLHGSGGAPLAGYILPSLAWVLWAEAGHGGGFAGGWSLGTDLLLVFGGVVTAVPLIGFAYGVRRIPLSVVGLLQYIAPTLQLLLGVWFFHEPFGGARALGFGAIWLGLAIYAGEGLWRNRRKAIRAG